MTKTAVKEKGGTLFGDVDVPPRSKNQTSEKTAPAARQKNAVAVRDPAAQSRSLMEIVKDAALDSRVDAGKMKSLLDMARDEQNRINDSIFEAAKFEVQKEIPPIAKDSWNDHTKSKWAKLEKISFIADPIIRKHGFSLSYSGAQCDLENHYRIVCDVTHVQTGYTKRYWIDVGMDAAGAKGGGTKSLAQGSGSSATYARRFLKVMIFDINVIGEDFDGSKFTVANQASPKAINHLIDSDKRIDGDQLAKLDAAIKFCGVGENKFCERYKIDKVADLPASLFNEAVKACQDYVGRKEAGKK